MAIKPVFTFIIERKGRVQGRKTYDFLCRGDYRVHKRISPSLSQPCLVELTITITNKQKDVKRREKFKVARKRFAIGSVNHCSI